MNQKSPKDSKLILILIIKLLYTYFSKMLPTGAFINLACTNLAHLSPNRATHLKSPKNDKKVDSKILGVCFVESCLQSMKNTCCSRTDVNNHGGEKNPRSARFVRRVEGYNQERGGLFGYTISVTEISAKNPFPVELLQTE